MRNATILDNDQIRRLAPSVFASTPWHAMSHNYRFVPTIEVVEMLREARFQPVLASQSKSRIPGKGDFTKHMLRFRHEDYLGPAVVDKQVPEVVLVNGHDGSSAFKFYAGVFRFVCSNGMVIASHNAGSISVRHQGDRSLQDQIMESAHQIASEAPHALEQIVQWQKITLEAPQQERLAGAALELRGNSTLKPRQLLAPRRNEDNAQEDGSRDLWTTYNVIQENVMKGGQRAYSASGRRTKTRAIRSVSEDLRLNRGLWEVTEHAAEMWG